MKTRITSYLIPAITMAVLAGCGGSNDVVESDCNPQEPAWTQQVAPMVTRQDGGEAAAIVHGVDILTSGILFSDVNINSANLNAAPVNTNSINILTQLFSPDMSLKSKRSTGLIAKKHLVVNTQQTSNIPVGTFPCNYGGSVTTAYSSVGSGANASESLSFSFDNCKEDSEFIGMMTRELYSIFGQIIPSVLNSREAGVSTPKVLLDGTIAASYKSFQGEDSLPAWMGKASWSCTAEGDRPNNVTGAYLRGKLSSDKFSAKFTSADTNDSMLFSSSIELYFEERVIEDFAGDASLRDGLEGDEPGFFDAGWYRLAGVHGCLGVSRTTDNGTENLLSMRALNLGMVLLLEGDMDSTRALLMKLNGFIEASAYMDEDNEFTLAFKAGDFYRTFNGYTFSNSREAEPFPPPPIADTIYMMGYLGSSCMNGMLFVDGELKANTPMELPFDGLIEFYDRPSCDANAEFLGFIDFNANDSGDAELLVDQTSFGEFSSWETLIGENNCTFNMNFAPFLLPILPFI